MKNFKNKKESGISRVVGIEESGEQELLDYFKRKFESQSKDELEVEHTPELDLLISQINEKMEEFMAKYGVRSLEIPSRNIHIYDKSKLDPQRRKQIEERYEKTGAFYVPIKQLIVLFRNYIPGNKLYFAESLIHEMMHANSFASVQKVKEGRAEIAKGEETLRLGVRRSGLEISTKAGRFLFFYINEAIIEELVIRFDRKYFSEFPDLKQEYDDRKEAIEAEAKRERKKESEILISGLEHRKKDAEGSHEVLLRTYSYRDEREKLNQLVNDLYKKNKNEFQSPEDVFTLLAKAVLNGQLLPIARLIEKTYGKGSFREIGEKHSKTLK